MKMGNLYRLLVVCCLALSTKYLPAESTLIFPRLTLQQDTITGLAIVNPNAEDAEVTLTAFGPDGSPLEIDGNPATYTLPGGSQWALTATELFGSSAAEVAWIEGRSDVDDLTGFFLFLNSEVSLFDGAEVSRTEFELAFNEVRIDPGYETEINLVNPGLEPAEATITLWGSNAPLEALIEIPARGVLRREIRELFDISEDQSGNAFFATVHSNVPLAGFEFVFSPGDILGLNARPLSEQLNRLFFPQFAVLGGIQSNLLVANYSDTAAIVTLTARQPDGTLFQPQAGSNPKTISLNPKAAFRTDLEEFFGFQGVGILDGWLEVAATSSAINGSLTYAVPEIQSIASVGTAAQGRKRAIFSHVATDLGFFTGVAALNAGSLNANLEIVVLQPDGAMVGRRTAVLAPGQRISRLIEELVGEAAEGMAGGLIWVNSDLPLYFTSLFGNGDSGVLANIPPQPVPDGFQPQTGSTRLEITPPLAVVQPGRSHPFSLKSGAQGTVNWSVATSSSGTDYGQVDPSGTYHAPSTLPPGLPVIVTATADTQIAGASVDVVEKSQLFESIGVIQTVAYLQSLRRLYVAELQGSGAFTVTDRLPAQADRSTIYDLTEDLPREVIHLDGEVVPKMVPFSGSDGREYLLVIAQLAGEIIRLDPLTRAQRVVLFDLDGPTALVVDEAEGVVLVAEKENVRSFNLDLLNAGLSPAGNRLQQTSPLDTFFSVPNGRIAIDECTGDVYASVAQQGSIFKFDRLTGAVRRVAEELQDPGQILGIFRGGVSCPAAFHLIVSERGAGYLTLLIPSQGYVQRWVEVPAARDLIFLPEENPFIPLRGDEETSAAGVLIAEADGAITVVPLPALYRDASLNPPELPPLGPCSISQFTDSLLDVLSATLSRNGEVIAFSSRADLTGENSDQSEEAFLQEGTGDLIQLTNTSGTRRSRVVGLNADGNRVLALSDANLAENGGPAPIGLYLLDRDTEHWSQLPGAVVTSATMDELGEYIAYASLDDPLEQNPDHNSEIFLYRSTTTEFYQITSSTSGTNQFPVISGNGTRGAFVSTADLTGDNPEGAVSLYLFEVATRELSFVTPLSSEPLLSGLFPVLINRSGTLLIFTSRLDLTGGNPLGNPVVFLYEILTGEIRQVTPSSIRTTASSTALDGRLIAVTSQGDPLLLNRDGNGEIFFLNTVAGSVHQVTRSRRTLNVGPLLSGAGSRIFFLSDGDYAGTNPDRSLELFTGVCRPD